jgi:hypothetical protein
MTGFAYESLNVLHRWSARFIIVLTAIHIGGRIYVSRKYLGGETLILIRSTYQMLTPLSRDSDMLRGDG